MVPPKHIFPYFFSERSTKLPVNSSSLQLGSFHEQTRTCLSLIAPSTPSQSHHLTCTLAMKRLGHAPVTKGEEAESRTLPFLAPCLQLAHVWQVPRDHQSWPVAWPVSLCPTISFSEMFWPAEVAEHSQVVVGSPGERSSAVKRKAHREVVVRKGSSVKMVEKAGMGGVRRRDALFKQFRIAATVLWAAWHSGGTGACCQHSCY